jgi:hypothetical protein
MIKAVIEPGYGTIETFAFEPIRQETLPLHVGSIKWIKGIWDKNQIQIPEPLGLGVGLDHSTFYKRNVGVVHWGLPAGFDPWSPKKYFFKPWVYKAFDTHIAKRCKFYDQKYIYSDVVNFSQEWRVYCQGNSILGMGRYDDLDEEDISKNEIESFCQQVIEAWKNKPSAYAIDVGWIEGVGLAIVELTDAWALGFYKGMDSKLYAQMLETRWKEIVYFR